MTYFVTFTVNTLDNVTPEQIQKWFIDLTVAGLQNVEALGSITVPEVRTDR